MMLLADESASREWLRGLPEYDAVAGERLERLVALLAEENSRQNLVSSASLAEVWLRHIADSAQLLRLVSYETTESWLDLGTGAGFPGLVIAIMRPECAITLLESRPRRAEWLERARIAMDLGAAKVIGHRLEQLKTGPYQVISARAFAPLTKLLNLSARFSTESTQWLLPKGRSAQQELDRLSGWRHRFHVEHSLTDADAGIIVGNLLGRMGRKS